MVLEPPHSFYPCPQPPDGLSHTRHRLKASEHKLSNAKPVTSASEGYDMAYHDELETTRVVILGAVYYGNITR